MCFNDEGYLPPGIHEMTWDEFYDQFSFSPKRKTLLEGLKRAMEMLKQCSCTVIYIDGSFVTQKLEPNDYDACWDGDWDEVSTNMMRFEPIFIDSTDLSTGRKVQKQKYGGEIFPASFLADRKTIFIDFFQQVRHSTTKKGIVSIIL